MALLITGDEVECVLREVLPKQGHALKNPPRKIGETGADIISEKGRVTFAIECIGFQSVPPLRSKQFYEVFFRAISRLKDGAQRCVIAVPKRFGRGLRQRAAQYGEAWARISQAFPELRIWLVDTEKRSYTEHHWGDWLAAKPATGTWNPREGTIGHLVAASLCDRPDITYREIKRKVLRRFPNSKFNKSHFAWYKWRMRR